MRGFKLRYLLGLSLLLLSIECFAQSEMEQDTLRVAQVTHTDTTLIEKPAELIATPIKSPRKQRELNSTHAVLFSIIPGGGQIYNGQYWKVPIVIGAYTACYYAISWNNANLQEYTTAFRDIKSDRPMDFDSWKDFIPYGANPESYVNNTAFHDQLKRGRDFYRRNRDLSIIISAAVYILVMVDAYVDAELYNFDISPNLTLSYSPTYIPPTPQTPQSGYGVQLALRF